MQYFNSTYRRTGWEGRYRAAIDDDEHYLLTCIRYIELNPVRAWMVSSPGEYSWSSFRANAPGVPDDLGVRRPFSEEVAQSAPQADDDIVISAHRPRRAAMLNFSRRDRIAQAKNVDKGALKPALYDPPGHANRSAAASNPATRPSSLVPAAQSPQPQPPPFGVGSPGAPAAEQAPATAAKPEPPRSKLAVGINIQLKGVEISECDALIIEGHVEATVHSKTMEIAKPGTLKGTAFIDVAEIHGEFSGELTARTRLVVHGTGRVSGTIRYGKLVVEEGGELSGDVKRVDDTREIAVQQPPTPAAKAAHGPPPLGGVAAH